MTENKAGNTAIVENFCVDRQSAYEKAGKIAQRTTAAFGTIRETAKNPE